MSASRTRNPGFRRITRNIRLHERVTGEVNGKRVFLLQTTTKRRVYSRRCSGPCGV